MREKPNKSLQRTFDPSPIFAGAKTAAASNAAELRRWASGKRSHNEIKGTE